MKEFVIVFGNDHINSIGVIQSLGKEGYKSIALLYGNKSGLVKASKYTEYIISAKDPHACVEKLLSNIPKATKKIPIIPCSDMAALTLENNAERLREFFIFEFSLNYNLKYLYQKELQVKLAQQIGFNVPKSWNLGKTRIIPKDITYPCLIKPLVSCEGAKCDIRVCRTSEELIKNLNSLKFTQNILLQQYIDRDYEINILGCSLTSSDCVLPAIVNKLTLYPQLVGHTSFAEVIQLTDKTLAEKIKILIKEIGYVGLFSIEMMHNKDDGKFYFTEINLRNDGLQAFITKFGANLPINHIEDLLGLPLTKQKEICSGYYISDFHHFLSMLHRETSFLNWLKEIKKSQGFMLYFKEDKKPFFKQYSNWILTKLHLRKNESYE